MGKWCYEYDELASPAHRPQGASLSISLLEHTCWELRFAFLFYYIIARRIISWPVRIHLLCGCNFPMTPHCPEQVTTASQRSITHATPLTSHEARTWKQEGIATPTLDQILLAVLALHEREMLHDYQGCCILALACFTCTCTPVWGSRAPVRSRCSQVS